MNKRRPRSRYGHYITFGRIEFHAPCITPALQRRQVLLEDLLIEAGADGAIQEAVICE